MSQGPVQLPQPGELFLERYEVIEQLGQGAMGAVYRLHHKGLRRDFALKVMLPEFSLNDDYRARFEREARINARLTHPNAVQVYDTGVWRGLLYIIMELLSGGALRERMTDGQPAPLALTLSVGEQLAQVLVAAHAMQLVHRDLKPENLMLEATSTGEPRLVVVDFGLAFIADASDLRRMTQVEGRITGTPMYLSPEQASGSRDIGPATDLYAMGVILYELMTGLPPFDAPTVMEILTRHLFVPPTPPSQLAPNATIPPALEVLVMQLLHKEAARRPSADDALRAMHELIASPDDTGRSVQVLQSRAQRMVEGQTRREAPSRDRDLALLNTEEGLVPTAPHRPVTSRQVAILGELSVLGQLPDADMMIALGACGIRARAIERVEQASVGAVVFAPVASAAQLEAMVEAGYAVMAGVFPQDLDRITALARAGVMETVTLPIDHAELVRKTQRALRKAKRRR